MKKLEIIFILCAYFSFSYGYADSTYSQITKDLLAIECSPGDLQLVETKKWLDQGDKWNFEKKDKDFYEKFKKNADKLSSRTVEFFFKDGNLMVPAKSKMLKGGYFSKSASDIPKVIDGCPTKILIAALPEQYNYAEKYIVDKDGFESLGGFDKMVFSLRISNVDLNLVRVFADIRNASKSDLDRLQLMRKTGGLTSWYKGVEVVTDIGDEFNQFDKNGNIVYALIRQSNDQLMDAFLTPSGQVLLASSILSFSEMPSKKWMENNFYLMNYFKLSTENFHFPLKQTLGNKFEQSSSSSSSAGDCSVNDRLIVYRRDGSLVMCGGDYYDQQGTKHELEFNLQFHVSFTHEVSEWWDNYYVDSHWAGNKKALYALDGQTALHKVFKNNYTTGLILEGLKQKPKSVLFHIKENCGSIENRVKVSKTEEYDKYGEKLYKAHFPIPAGCSGVIQFEW